MAPCNKHHGVAISHVARKLVGIIYAHSSASANRQSRRRSLSGDGPVQPASSRSTSLNAVTIAGSGVGEVVYSLLKYSLTLEAINFRRSAKKVS